MPRVIDELERLKFLVSKGRGDEVCHVVLPAEDAKARVKNEKQRTRVIWETDSPHAYSELNAEKDRYVSVVGNKTVAFSIMLAVLKGRSDEDLRKMASDD